MQTIRCEHCNELFTENVGLSKRANAADMEDFMRQTRLQVLELGKRIEALIQKRLQAEPQPTKTAARGFDTQRNHPSSSPNAPWL